MYPTELPYLHQSPMGVAGILEAAEAQIRILQGVQDQLQGSQSTRSTQVADELLARLRVSALAPRANLAKHREDDCCLSLT